MKFIETKIKGVYVIDLHFFEDNRGAFARTFCKKEFQQIGHHKPWVQLNHSITHKKGTIRGLHFQYPPFKEVKLIRCVAGGINDIVVDIRQDSSTFLEYVKVNLSAQNKKMLYIPEGLAHGFQTLTDNCELIYHHTEFYTPGHEGGIRFDDKKIDIYWDLPVGEISERDEAHPLLNHNFRGI